MKLKFHTVENFMAYVWKFFSMREEENFLAGRNKFIYGKKFSGLREEIPRLTIFVNCNAVYDEFNAVYNRLATAV